MDRTLSRYADALLGLVRIVAGLLFLEHGLIKLSGWPPGPPGHQALFSLLGAAGLLELVCGGLILLGLFTRPAAFIASGEMAFAYFMVHAKTSLFPSVNGGDAAILFCFLFLYLATAGSGGFSLDRMIWRRGDA